jgi:hypothetical protein
VQYLISWSPFIAQYVSRKKNFCEISVGKQFFKTFPADVIIRLFPLSFLWEIFRGIFPEKMPGKLAPGAKVMLNKPCDKIVKLTPNFLLGGSGACDRLGGGVARGRLGGRRLAGSMLTKLRNC